MNERANEQEGRKEGRKEGGREGGREGGKKTIRFYRNHPHFIAASYGTCLTLLYVFLIGMKPVQSTPVITDTLRTAIWCSH